MTPKLVLPATAFLLAAAPALATPPRHHAARHHAPTPQAANTQLAPIASPSHPAIADANAAPVPNQNITAPVDNSDQQTTVKPTVMSLHYPPQGDGYVTGSSAQAMDDREAAKVNGVQLHVPLGN